MRGPLIDQHKFRTFLAVAAQVLQHGASVLILPIIVFSFSPEALGIWYIVVSFQSGVFLLDMGFTTSFARAIAQAFSGIQGLTTVGWSSPDSAQPNHTLVNHIIRRMVVIYMIIGGASFCIMLMGGVSYLSFLDIKEFSHEEIVTICSLAALAIAIQFFGQWITACLIGAGLTHHNQISILCSRLTFLLCGLGFIYFEYGIIGLLIGNLLGNIVGLIYKFYAHTRKFPRPTSTNVRNTSEPVLRVIWHNAWRIGLVGLCSFFILRFGVLLLGSLEGLEAAGILGLLIQISTTIIAAASMPWQVGMSSLVRLKIAKNLGSLRKFAATNWSLSFLISLSALLAITGLELLGLFTGTQFEGLIFTQVFAIFAVILLLEVNHTIAAHYIASGNYVPFLPAAVTSAILIVVLSTVLVMRGWGITGILLAQGFVQLLWNNWFWPYKVWTELHAKA